MPVNARSPIVLAALACGVVMLPLPLQANNVGDNGAWTFQSSADRQVRATVNDMVEKKKGGQYQSVNPSYNTYIYRQVNCSQTVSTVGNSGTNTTTASTSSPVLNNSGTTSSLATANEATNGLPLNGIAGMVTASAGELASGALNNTQSNTGSQSSSVSGSNTSASTGAVTAGSGTSSQSLNSTQSTAGTMTSAIHDATACAGGFPG